MTGAVGTVLAITGATAAIAAPPPTGTAPQVAACDPENSVARGDIDGDYQADVVVGMPWHRDGAGSVDVHHTRTPAALLNSPMLGGGGGDETEFGAAVAVGDLDRDGCADLVIGAPGEFGDGVPTGQVHIVFGSPDGIDPDTAVRLPHAAADGDNFGTALALNAVHRNGAVAHDLYVGAPGTAVGGRRNAGQVYRYTLTPSPDRRIVTVLREVRHQDSTGVPGTSEAGDRFGSVLAGTDSGGVLVGAPQEDVGSVPDAGAVWHLPLNAAGAPVAAQSWSQDSAGVPGAPEAEDHFGAAVSSRGSVMAVGVPEEDDGSKADSGMVQVFNLNERTGQFAPGTAITQNTARIPGTVEAGDRFGTTVAVGVALHCEQVRGDIAIGAPGEDLGTVRDAGSVTLMSFGTDGCRAPVAVSQGSGLADKAEAGDQVGSVLGLVRGDRFDEDRYADRLLIGVPDEDLGATADAGFVQPARGRLFSNRVGGDTLTFSSGADNADHYGNVLSSPSG